MKQLIFSVSLQLFALLGLAQSHVSGLIQEEGDHIALIGAHVTLQQPSTNLNRATISDSTGRFLFEQVPAGEYQLTITYVGYQDFHTSFTVSDVDLNLGLLSLKEGVELSEIEVVEQVLPVQQRGDTTVLKAEAYKTLPDASAEALIEKMPTVVVDNGKVQAQGEDVKQVLVDGKPFFGNDPTAALRNLPAEIIDKIEIFDRQSEQSQFTGFEDGETSKTINIITKKDMRNGQFGKLYAGYGYEDRYEAGGNVNFFNGDQRISLIAMSNNINQQNFSSEDLLGVVGESGNRRRGRGPGGGGNRGGGGGSASDFLVGQQAGISQTHAAGINFSDQWGKQVEVHASYFFNRSDNTSEQLVNQPFFSTEGNEERYIEEGLTQSTNVNHRFSAELDYTINERNSLDWQPRLSLQTNNGLESVLGQTNLANTSLSQSDNRFSADLSTLNFSNDLTWKHNFEKRRRTFSIRLTSGLAPKMGSNSLFSENRFQDSISLTTFLDQQSTLDLNSWNASANLNYTEPMGKKGMLMLSYRSSFQQEESAKETFDFNEATAEYDLFNQELSNIFSNDYWTQSVGAGYTFRSGDWRLMARANVQYASLLNEQEAPFANSYENTFLNVLPMVMLRYSKSRTENLRLFYRSNTQLPAISQLQNVLDNSNPLQWKLGNPELAQSFGHSLFARYTKTNTEKSTIFFALLGGTYTNDYVASSTYLAGSDHPIFAEYAVQPGAQLSLPVNLDGQWSTRALLTYGFPVAPIKSNLNIDLSGNFSRTPGLVNEVLNNANSTNTGLGLTLSSNISERIDFTLSSRSSYNTVRNNLQTSTSTHFFNQNSRLKLDWIIAKGFVFRTQLTHQFFDGFGDAFTQNYLLWNMSIGKKLLKNDRAEISLSVFDLLNQNTDLERNVTETFIQDVQTNVLQRYVLLSFRYDVRNFGKEG